MYIVQVTKDLGPHPLMGPLGIRIRKCRNYKHELKAVARKRQKNALAAGHHVRVLEVRHVPLFDSKYGPKRF